MKISETNVFTTWLSMNKTPAVILAVTMALATGSAIAQSGVRHRSSSQLISGHGRMLPGGGSGIIGHHGGTVGKKPAAPPHRYGPTSGSNTTVTHRGPIIAPIKGYAPNYRSSSSSNNRRHLN